MKFTAEQIAGILEGDIVGNPDVEVSKLSKIEEGTKGSLTFLANPKYTSFIYSTQASITIVNKTLIRLNGKVRETWRDNSYFQILQPHNKKINSLDNGEFFYGFCLYPKNLQPSGTTNFTEIEDIRFLFEINDTAIDILKEYFINTSLGKEYKLYESILKSKVISEGRATLVIDTILEASTKFNRKSLKKQKYNLINEIKKHYNLESFFGSKITNYKELAALYTLVENVNSSFISNPTQLVDNKITLLEHLTKKEVNQDSKQTVLKEFLTYDKDVRTLTYKVLLEKFNNKYDTLTDGQKQVLKEYINSVDSTPDLRNFYNGKILELKSTLSKITKNIKDKATQIKITEVSKFLTELNKTDKVNSNNLVDLLQYYDLVNEIKTANGQVQIKA